MEFHCDYLYFCAVKPNEIVFSLAGAVKCLQVQLSGYLTFDRPVSHGVPDPEGQGSKIV